MVLDDSVPTQTQDGFDMSRNSHFDIDIRFRGRCAQVRQEGFPLHLSQKMCLGWSRWPLELEAVEVIVVNVAVNLAHQVGAYFYLLWRYLYVV